jgi:hypothetical protein
LPQRKSIWRPGAELGEELDGLSGVEPGGAGHDEDLGEAGDDREGHAVAGELERSPST